MKLLIGINGVEDEAVFQEFLSQLKEYGVLYETCERRYKKSGIEEYLEQHLDIDILIVSEYLEELYPFTKKDFEHILEEYEGIRIIPILTDSEKGSHYIADLFQLGIYEGVFQEDASLENIAKIILNRRNRKNAKLYYQVKEEDITQTGANIESCVAYIENASSPKEIIEQAQYVKRRITLREFDIVLEQLSEETLDILQKSKEFACFFGNSAIEEQLLEKEKKESVKKSICKLSETIPKIKWFASQRPLVEEKEKIKNVQIGIAGLEHGIGVTHQAIVIARLLASRNYRVAYLQGESENKILNTILHTYKVEKTKDYFRYQGVDYYPKRSIEHMEQILNREEYYHYIVIDYGIADEEISKKITNHQYQMIVARGNIWDREAIELFQKRTIQIANQYCYLVRGGEEEEVCTWMKKEKVSYVMISENMNPFEEKNEEAIQKIFFDCTTREETGKSKKLNKWQQNLLKDKIKPISSRKRKKNMETNVIFVTSLKHGTGATHFSIGAANELSFHGKVCVIHPESSYMESELFDDIDFFMQIKGARELYKKCNYLLYDCGCIDELSAELQEEMKYATYKVMMCFSDDEYLEKLAKFIKSIGNVAQEWLFVFNIVTKEKKVQIDRIMNCYDTVYLPLYDLEIIPKGIKKMYQELFI